ncbi:cation-translocating P-type ATPase [Paenibacillus periandrae]|uniref:cation-translocating P-type ATPase n=1 Tax=Paenibacillus periandrae TaxID=1761741 RepID=UPI001F091677|nr:HAD-IC family P-type ATPase [Paenibacillus periandrae]
MLSLDSKTRFIRVLPGRLRIEVCGLKGNKKTAEELTKQFSALNGMQKVAPCPASGRILLVFDEKRISLEHLYHMINCFENQLLHKTSDDHNQEDDFQQEKAKQEVAAASEMEAQPWVSDIIPDRVRTIAKVESEGGQLSEKVPLPLAVSMGGLAVLGVKQLLMGKSALATSPAPFYLSGLVSVVTGYPFLSRGIRKWAQGDKWNSDIVLGTGALALALIRENLVVLAGLSLLQYVNWKRGHSVGEGRNSVNLSPQIKEYSEKAGKWGMIAAVTTLALTRDPLRGIAVLLAANPRPATIPAAYAWNQAELVSTNKNHVIPSNGSLAQLAQTKTLLIEDSSRLFIKEIREIECITYKNEEDKIICLAASLLRKSNHSWKEEVWNKAKQSCRTIRTAYQIEEEEEGIKGKINDCRVFIGSVNYLQQHGIECSDYHLEAKRLAKKGAEVLFVAKQVNKSDQCLGLLVRQQEAATEYGSILNRFIEKGWEIAITCNSIQVARASFSRYGIGTNWLSLQEGEVLERIAAKQQQGENVLFVSCTQQSSLCEMLKEAGISSIELHQLEAVWETAEYVEQIEQTVNQHLSVTKQWNLVGGALATMGMLSAPVVNLAADALSLVFMSRSSKRSGHISEIHLESYNQEVAATAEAPSWYTVPREQILNRYNVNEQLGLTHEHVGFLRNQYGMNQLESRKPTPWLMSYLGQFKEFTTLILLGTTTLSIFTGGVFDGIAMGIILMANAAVGTIQERKAEKVFESLKQFQPPVCKAIREGQPQEMSATELVPGDIVCLEAGDRVPADLRLLSSWNLHVNESALTGESLPVEKFEAEIMEDCPLSERKNMLYMGTDVCGGKGIGLVVQTGMNTEMGHLMNLLKTDEKEVTPLQEKVTSISKRFIKGALVAGGLVFITGLLRGIPVNQMITTSITLAASAIPEGLPLTITIALSAGIFRMVKKKTLIRKLSALETLGRATIICSDKTGTLTKNEMTVKSIATVGRIWAVTGNGYEPIGDIEELSNEVAATANLEQTETYSGASNQPELQRILQIGLLCNNSKLEQLDGQWMIKGDPTEGALLTLAAKAGMWNENVNHWHRGSEVPFDSNTGKMSVVCKDTKTTTDCFVFSKGAVESILRHCNRFQANGEVYPLSDEQKQLILLQNEKLAGDALRVLGFAYRPTDNNEEAIGIDEKEMIYAGMVGMMDPPKTDVENSIREAFTLGVKPVMITGDHPITAIAIAKQLGLYKGTEKVISGYELERLSDEELIEIVEDVSIFARVTPEHKLRIVKSLQKLGHIVVMTGDGVNDTPAIKQANVGVAMGRTGTEVTKETADMVLQEDHFGSIVDGVKEGRTIIGNIRKALGCLLTGNLAEILVTSAAVMMGLPIPLVPIQILLMNLLTDALPAMILAVNPGNKTKLIERTDIVDKELYQKVVTRGVLLGAGALGLFGASLAAGVPIAAAQSVAFATLVAGQLIQTFSWRQEGTEETVRDWSKDKFLIGALGISWLALMAVIYVPPVSQFFHTVPLAWKYWIPILAVAGSVSLLSKPFLSIVSRLGSKPATLSGNPTAAVA